MTHCFVSRLILSKYQWIFAKLGVCIDIVEIWFRIVNLANFINFCQLSALDTSIFLFLDNNLSKYQWIFTKLGMCIDVVEIWFGKNMKNGGKCI